MDHDFESTKHGYSARSYIEVLDAKVALIFKDLDNGYEFMQDNASIHTVHTVQAWFCEHGICLVINWPPYSPDLNLIKHIWWHLKTRVVETFPDVAATKASQNTQDRG